uniref:hypothetical protein n=1 Tax=Ningiella ruwaisensis TaxID=2364274 RepID=UPI00109EEC0B|nr:hypothetical protein [Ningiella ruwaisensis]
MIRFIPLLFLLFLSACKSTPNYLNTDTLVAQYNRIGYVNFTTTSELTYFQPYLENFYSERVQNELRSLGFDVVDASALFNVLSELENKTDNLYNSNTGQLNEELHNQLFIEALETLKSQLNIDAFLFVGVDIVPAHFSNNVFSGYNASWWGQSEDYLAEGVDASEVLGSLFVNKTGHLPGARLYLRFRDAQNNIISFGGGGIELLARFDDDGELETKKPELLFDNESQLIEALNFAFENLASHRQKNR